MGNIKLVLEYDGTGFAGWQVQPQQRTVQGELERALFDLTREKVTVFAAGRTDGGVHAAAQVCNFHLKRDLPLRSILMGGNAHLPPDVRILRAEFVRADFHARYDAQRRIYRYTICQKPAALQRRFAWYYPQRLDLKAMQQACTMVVGKHDFRSFTPCRSDIENALCSVDWALWRKRAGQGLEFEIAANRFLHNMVRILVGTFVEIGRSKRRPADIKTLLKSADRRAAGPTVPAHGLVFWHVQYIDR